MQIYRLLIPGAPQQREDALAFAESIDPDDVAALREERQRMQ